MTQKLTIRNTCSVGSFSGVLAVENFSPNCTCWYVIPSDGTHVQRRYLVFNHKGRLRSNQGESNKNLAASLMKIGVDLKTFNKIVLFFGGSCSLFFMNIWAMGDF